LMRSFSAAQAEHHRNNNTNRNSSIMNVPSQLETDEHNYFSELLKQTCLLVLNRQKMISVYFSSPSCFLTKLKYFKLICLFVFVESLRSIFFTLFFGFFL
jgi:hypothetical protein